ncbi:DNA-binding protein [Micromonospora echinaurantiaca]|uniref:DNA-binding protein n=1 Tax=Micromonospora echinaurantiaca TaxID=47857 RepID=UPI0034293EBD
MSDDDIPRAAGAPARGALAAAGWTRLSQLTGVTERELLALHGVGPKAVRVLRAALRERGLGLAGDPPDTDR